MSSASESGSGSESTTSPARKKAKILFIDKECFLSARVMAHVYADMERDNYVSDDWSTEFYLLQALRGFIAVGHETAGGNQLLLPQLQTTYCVFDWSSIEGHKSLRKQIRKLKDYRLKINHDLKLVLDRLETYHTDKSWLCPAYKELCMNLDRNGIWNVEGIVRGAEVDFQHCSVELYDGEGELVAGELGYVAGSVYTALSGFCNREKHLSLGKIQMLALAQLLKQNGFSFMNLGQPPIEGKMQYKTELGGEVLDRFAFLEKWNHSLRQRPSGFNEFVHADILLHDLFPRS